MTPETALTFGLQQYFYIPGVHIQFRKQLITIDVCEAEAKGIAD